MRGLWSTIVLVVVLAGLGGYIYFVDSDRTTSGLSDKDKVFAVEADAIEEVTLVSQGQTSTVRRIDGVWRLTSPVQADADETTISSLTSNIATLEINRVVDENPSDLGEYGLDDPRVQVTFRTRDGATGQLHLGDTTATQGDIYAVKPGDGAVFLVQSWHETTFQKTPFDLRDKRVLKFERDKVDAIEIARAGASPVQLARSGTDWKVIQPLQARGDYSMIEGLLTRLSSANMSRIVEGAPEEQPAPLARYGLDKPAASITVGTGSSRATLTFGREEDGAVFARDEARGVVFTVDSTLAGDMKRPADDYRDKSLFEFRTFNATAVQITRGSETYEFVKGAGNGENATEQWQRKSTDGAASDLDSMKMGDLLSELSGMRAQSFTDTADRTGLDRPALAVSVTYDEGKTERVRIARTGGEAFAARDGEPGAARIDAAAYDELVQALDAVIAPPEPPATP
jgi:hypothetical protein